MEEHREPEALVVVTCKKCEQTYETTPVKLATQITKNKVFCPECILLEKKLKLANKRHGFRFGV